MSTFDFETLPDRSGMGCSKWERRSDAEKAAGVLPMWIADMDLYTAPCVMEAVTRAAASGAYGYTDVSEAYLAAVYGWMESRHGFAVSPEWILQQNGVVPAISIAIRAFTEPGDRILIQPPYYPPFPRMAALNGREAVFSPLVRDEDNRYRMDFDDLREKTKDPRVKLMILCSPHNPTGRIWTMEELKTLSDICRENGVIVLSDEIHFDFALSGRHTVFHLAASGMEEHCAILTAPSKTFNVAGLQLSNIIIPGRTLREKYRARQVADGYENPSFFGYQAVMAAYREGGPWLDALLCHLRENAALLEDWLSSRLPMVRFSPPESTYLAWMDARALPFPSLPACAYIREKAGVILTDGAAFGETWEGFLRMNIALPQKVLAQALDRIERALRRDGLL